MASTLTPSVTRPGPLNTPKPIASLAPVSRHSPHKTATLESRLKDSDDLKDTSVLSTSPKDATLSSTTTSNLPQSSPSNASTLLSSTSSVKPNKEALSIEILVGGFVESYVDFFYITHRDTITDNSSKKLSTISASSTTSLASSSSKPVDIPDETLVFLKDMLTSGESFRRKGQSDRSLHCYKSLAEYFDSVNDFNTSLYFYERCLQVAAEAQDIVSQGAVYLHLGICHEKRNDMRKALEQYLLCFEIGEIHNVPSLVIQSSEKLVETYKNLAQESEKNANLDEAIVYHQKCLDSSMKSGQAVLEGEACYRLGCALMKKSDYRSSIAFFNRYLLICTQRRDRVGEGKARASLASAWQSLGNPRSAIDELEKLLDVATETGEVRAQCDACLSLGMMYNEAGENEQSIKLLERHFELAKVIGDRDLIDAARVNLGMAKGNCNIDTFVNVVNADLATLLSWKNKRSSLPRSSSRML